MVEIRAAGLMGFGRALSALPTQRGTPLVKHLRAHWSFCLAIH